AGSEPQESQIQISAVRADCLSDQLQPVEHQVRRGPEQELVLLARRLAFRTVGNDDRAPTPVYGGGQLGCRRKSGSASTSEAGGVHVRDQPSLASAVRQGGRTKRGARRESDTAPHP